MGKEPECNKCSMGPCGSEKCWDAPRCDNDRLILEALKRYVHGDCRICKHRMQLNNKFPNKSGAPCCDCDEMDLLPFEIDEDRLIELTLCPPLTEEQKELIDKRLEDIKRWEKEGTLDEHLIPHEKVVEKYNKLRSTIIKKI